MKQYSAGNDKGASCSGFHKRFSIKYITESEPLSRDTIIPRRSFLGIRRSCQNLKAASIVATPKPEKFEATRNGEIGSLGSIIKSQLKEVLATINNRNPVKYRMKSCKSLIWLNASKMQVISKSSVNSTEKSCFETTPMNRLRPKHALANSPTRIKAENKTSFKMTYFQFQVKPRLRLQSKSCKQLIDISKAPHLLKKYQVQNISKALFKENKPLKTKDDISRVKIVIPKVRLQ